MLIFNTTYTDKSDESEINELVGTPFSFFKRIQLKGIGSKRMIIYSVSKNFKKLINNVSDINYANIELRPKGIIVHFTQQLRRYSWAIPYYKLVIFNGDYFSIHSDSSFIQLMKAKGKDQNRSIIQKIFLLKSKISEEYEFR
ncbi:hypothetical protein [Tenacibaculum sp. nBUS_03]|uniref:hypothetical protein n=1 Tax=Tenacibaculum sp. nBUS_03 TaxID=3395320 RepID=UPI003EC02501